MLDMLPVTVQVTGPPERQTIQALFNSKELPVHIKTLQGLGRTHNQLKIDVMLIPPSSLHHVVVRSDSKPLHLPKVYLSLN